MRHFNLLIGYLFFFIFIALIYPFYSQAQETNQIILTNPSQATPIIQVGNNLEFNVVIIDDTNFRLELGDDSKREAYGKYVFVANPDGSCEPDQGSPNVVTCTAAGAETTTANFSIPLSGDVFSQARTLVYIRLILDGGTIGSGSENDGDRTLNVPPTTFIVSLTDPQTPSQDRSLTFDPNPVTTNNSKEAFMAYSCSEGYKVKFHWVKEGGNEDGSEKTIEDKGPGGIFITTNENGFSRGTYQLIATCYKQVDTVNDGEQVKEDRIVSTRSLFFFVDEEGGDFTLSTESDEPIDTLQNFSIVAEGPFTDNCYSVTIKQIRLSGSGRDGDAIDNPDGQGVDCIHTEVKSGPLGIGGTNELHLGDFPEAYRVFEGKDVPTFSVPGLPQGVYRVELRRFKSGGVDISRPFSSSATDLLTTLTIFVGDPSTLADVANKSPMQCEYGIDKDNHPVDLRGLTGAEREERAATVVRCGAVPTALGLLNIEPVSFISTILGVLLSVSGGIALLLIIRSGYQLMTSSGNPEAIQEARERITSAIVGLLFVIFSLVVLQVIGIDILHLPGFGGTPDIPTPPQGSGTLQE